MRKSLLFILLISLCAAVQGLAQTRTVEGKVTDDKGNPVSGASIKAKGTKAGTYAKEDGTFKLTFPDTAKTIVVSSVNHQSQELGIGSQNKIDIVLSGSSAYLEEVVVTALGMKKQQKGVGYSVSTIKADELVKSGESNVIEGLAAKATGVQVTSSSGTPGASSKVILRGPATFSGDNQPLIIVDGVPIDNSVNNVKAGDDPYNNGLAGTQLSNRAIDLNPEDIESVTILKGPAAAALYGQAAGNGAIIYTTKKGSARKGLGVNFSSSLELQNVSQLPDIQYRYGQGSNGVYSAATPNSWGPDLIAAGKPVYNNVDNFFTTGKTYNNNLSLSGGNDKSTFRLSVGATNMTGIIPNTKLNRYSVRLSGDTKLSDFLTAGGTVGYTNTQGTRVQNGSNLAGIMLPLLRMPADFDGRNYINPDGTQNTYFSAYDNPFFSARMNPFTDETDRLIGNVYANAKLSNVFSLSWKVGTDVYNTNGKQIYAYSSMGNDNADGTGQVNKTTVSFRNLYSDLMLNFKKSFGKEGAFSLNGFVGGNYNYTQLLTNYMRGRVLAIPGFYGLSGLKELYASDEDQYRNSKAVFGEATLDYKSVLYLTFTGRTEWSTTFGKGSKGYFYPKADVAYVFSHLLQGSHIINYGKVRLAYSNVGISPNVYSDRTYYLVPNIADGFTSGLSFPYLGQNGYAISQTISGFDLKPERNVGIEAGLEMKFFDSRIGLDATVYQQTSNDLLIQQPVAPTSGFQYKYINIGKIRNKGIELGVTADVFKNKEFDWNIAVNWSKNVNEVLQLAPGVDEVTIGDGFTTPQSYAIVGKPFGVLYGTKYQRDENGKMLINSASGLPIPEATTDDIGNPLPNWLMNINNAFSYKGFNFSFLWDIRQGGQIWNGTWANLNFRGKSKESEARTQTYVIDGVYGNGPNKGQTNSTAISANSYFTNYLGNSGSEVSIQDGSWVRLRSINLSYRFNFQKQGNPHKALQYVELGASLRNMILITNYKGVDPETSLTGSDQNFNGYDYFNNPGTKSVIFNLKVGL